MTEHPYLDTSHIPDFVDDRGPAEYFHGRTKILDSFKKLLHQSAQKGEGTIFLIQGAPGVGKSALLHELEKLALENGWKTTKNKMYPPALWTPSELHKSLGHKIRSKFSGPVGIGVQATPIGVKAEWAQKTTLNILSSGEKPLILQLDEAQTIGTTNAPPPNLKSAATNILDAIHNGGLGRPVILIVAGLGLSKDVFANLGISRFKAGCSIELGALSKQAEHAVIHDWLVTEGGAKGDPTAWIDAIAKKTHGWPQHITAYGDAAARQTQKDNGAMTSTGLEVVYQAGMTRCKAYYRQRVEGVRGNELICLYESIADIESGTPFNEDQILAPLDKKYGPERAEKIFKKIIDKGILSPVGALYSVPIPSMHDWIKSELKQTHERLGQVDAIQSTESHSRSIGPERNVSPPIIEPRQKSIQKQPIQSNKDDNPPRDRDSKFNMGR